MQLPNFAVPDQLDTSSVEGARQTAAGQPSRGEVVRRPVRWDKPFAGAALPSDLIKFALSHRVFSSIDPSGFPEDLGLVDIIANDTRPLRLKRGQALYRSGQYDTSVYLTLHGEFEESEAALIGVGEALTRQARQCSMTVRTDEAIVLQVRWSGVRELRQWSASFRALTDQLHHAHAIEFGLARCPDLDGIGGASLSELARHARLEMFGRYDWSHGYRNAVETAGYQGLTDHEDLIAGQGDYLDEIIIVASGFVRLTTSNGGRERTLGTVGAGGVIGLRELIDRQSNQWLDAAGFSNNVRAVGYATVIRLPVHIVEATVLPSLNGSWHKSLFGASPRGGDAMADPRSSPTYLAANTDFAVDRRLMNGTQAMAINLDRCVHCDECVRACAATHNGVARFVRRGDVHANVMVAHACMHCHDPVCMIGCPTGAIDRHRETGHVIVDESKCIGCTICASTCPYGNIRMEQVHAPSGSPLVGEDGGAIMTAVKCDLCYDQPNGPACQRACPYDALRRVDIGDGDGLRDGGWR